MATIGLENQVPSQALRGQNVKITLSGSDAVTYLSQLSVGMECENGASGAIGYIYSIDYYGNSFEISPAQPDFNMSDDDKGFWGYCSSGIGILVTIS